MLKYIITAVSIGAATTALSGQIISSFNSLAGENYGGVWVEAEAISIGSGVATIGSPALGDGNFEYADIDGGALSISPDLALQYTARVNSGNLSNSFTVRLSDSEGTYVYNAVIVTTSWMADQWVTGSVVLTSSGSRDANDISFFTITGDNSSNAFRMSFDAISAIPEPSSYAALAGGMMLGLTLIRRRRLGLQFGSSESRGGVAEGTQCRRKSATRTSPLPMQSKQNAYSATVRLSSSRSRVTRSLEPMTS